MNSKYVYDDTQKGMFEKAREAAGFIAWCVAIGGGMGGVYGYRTYGGFDNTVYGFVTGMSVFAFFGVMKKLLTMK